MNATAMNLEALTRTDLYRLATAAHINRRSTMNKAQLTAAIEALAETDPTMYGALELHYSLNYAPEVGTEAPADTATPERIALVHALADHDGADSGTYSELCDTFRREGMGNLDADTAAWALWVRYLHGEFPRATAPAPAAAEEEPAPVNTEPTVTVTFPAALRTIIEDTDALDGLHTAPGGARGSLRITGTREQLADFTVDRLWVCAYNTASEPNERAAYRRWVDALESAGVTL